MDLVRVTFFDGTVDISKVEIEYETEKQIKMYDIYKRQINKSELGILKHDIVYCERKDVEEVVIQITKTKIKQINRHIDYQKIILEGYEDFLKVLNDTETINDLIE